MMPAIFDRKDLQQHASGSLRELFGESFHLIDSRAHRIRLPQEPFLFFDRVIELEKGNENFVNSGIVTETDIPKDAWYLKNGRISPGVFCELVGNVLFLASWLGVDRLLQESAVVRSLGYDLTHFSDLPAGGETLRFVSRVNNSMRQGGLIILSCTNEGWVKERKVACFENSLYSFSSPKLLDNAVPARIDPSYSYHATEGSISSGAEFPTEGAEIQILDWKGGKWEKGYLKAAYNIDPEEWIFRAHFLGDSCLPGSFMFDLAYQLMGNFFLCWGRKKGITLNPLSPTKNKKLHIKYKGQVRPTHQNLVYEVHAKEWGAAPNPSITADVVLSVDGNLAAIFQDCSLMGSI